MVAQQPKVALVTGAAKRIGRSIALALARRGWDIVVHYRASADDAQQTVQDIRAAGRQAAALACDLADEAAVRALLPQAAELFGPVSCLVNNASLFSYDSAQDFSTAQLDAHTHVNLAAPILLAQALYEGTPESRQSVAVNILDQKLFNLNPDFLSYTLSKAALHSATAMLAQALAPRVRVVGIAPGLTMVSGDQTGQDFEKAHTITPLGRSSSPEDIADAVCFVAEARAITGAVFPVDGGQHLLSLQRDVMFLAR